MFTLTFSMNKRAHRELHENWQIYCELLRKAQIETGLVDAGDCIVPYCGQLAVLPDSVAYHMEPTPQADVLVVGITSDTYDHSAITNAWESAWPDEGLTAEFWTIKLSSFNFKGLPFG